MEPPGCVTRASACSMLVKIASSRCYTQLPWMKEGQPPGLRRSVRGRPMRSPSTFSMSSNRRSFHDVADMVADMVAVRR